MKKKMFRLANMVSLKSIMQKYHVSSSTLYNRMSHVPKFRKKYTMRVHRHLYVTKAGAKKIAYPPHNDGGRRTKQVQRSKHNGKKFPVKTYRKLSMKILQEVITAVRRNNKVVDFCSKSVKLSDKYIIKSQKNMFTELDHEDMSIQAAQIDIRNLKKQVKQLKEDKAWTHRVVAGVSALGFLGLIVLSHRLNKFDL